jgi:predicted dienelactone hydrolase
MMPKSSRIRHGEARRPRWTLALLLLAILMAPRAYSQIPAPTGPYAAGRTELFFTDSSRTEPFLGGLDTYREIAVSAWYPAEAHRGARGAAYVPHFAAIADALGDSLMRAEFGSAETGIASGTVRSHAVNDAPLLKTHRPFPVLVFSHGFQEASVTYSAQLEDLASHGYVVFAIEHPFDAYAVWLPPGRVVRFAETSWDSALAVPGGAVAYQLAQVPLRAADMRFVVNRIIHLNQDQASRFAGALDLRKIGVFGHSLGGIAAASVCRWDARVRACLNEDADDQGRPWAGGMEALPIKQPFMFFATGHSIYVSPRTPLPTDTQLVNMHLTRTQYDSIVGLYQRNQDRALRSLPGSIRVSAEREDFTHRSFIDLRVLQAKDGAELATQQRYLGVIRKYVRAFFDQSLRGVADSALAREGAVDSLVTVTHFGP